MEWGLVVVNPLRVLVGLVRFESMLALILAVVPIALRIADDRGSISAYHDMSDPRWFFVPLTAASMMLITNGLVRSDKHGYNTALGVLLLGVVLSTTTTVRRFHISSAPCRSSSWRCCSSH